MIWGTETLKNRSVTGVATKKKKDALPKPPLSPSKLKIVRGKIKNTDLKLWVQNFERDESFVSWDKLENIRYRKIISSYHTALVSLKYIH